MATLTVSAGSRTRVALRRLGRQRLLALLFVIPLAFLVLMPIYRLQTEALSNGAQAYSTEFGRERMPGTILATIGLAVGSLAIAMAAGTLLAWSATLLPARLRWMRVLPILPIVLPFVAGVLGWTFLLSPRPGYLNALLRRLPWWDHLVAGPIDVYTLPWIVIITGLTLTAFVYLFLSAGFQNINSELIEAAHVSGSGALGVFFRVILPMIRPSLLYGGAVALLIGLGQFTAPLLLGRQSDVNVLTTEIYYALYNRTPQDPAAAAAIASPLLIVGVAVVLGQKYLLGNTSRFVTHGGRGFRPIQRKSKFAVGLILTYLLLSTVLPLVALAVVSLSPFWSRRIAPGAFSLDNFRELFATPVLVDAVWTSIWISFLAVAICLPIGFIASSLLLRAKQLKVTRAVLDLIITLPLGVPAVVFGVGFLLTYTRDPFFLYGTKWVLLVAYVTIMLPFTTRMHMSGMTALGDAYVEASRVAGAGVVTTNLRIVLPLLRSSVGGAAALMFVLLTHEFTASLLIRSAQTQVMGTVLYDTYANGNYPLVAAVAMIMTAVTFAGVVVALSIGGSKVFEDL
ncbi:ABC transporter permease [Kribbella turkmenica]|uniref:ABC transporter permease n=1 Tax=Kribbella turkmenica TaxID=2530375 RepID=UPI001404D6E1|nr:iron ABC transporter permease [Kribbella turkmenica]